MSGLIDEPSKLIPIWNDIFGAISGFLGDMWRLTTSSPLPNFSTTSVYSLWCGTWSRVAIDLLAIQVGIMVVAWQLLYDNILQPIGHFLADVFTVAWDGVTGGRRRPRQVTRLNVAIVDGAKAMWHDYLEPIANFLGDAFAAAWGHRLVPQVADLLRAAWDTAERGRPNHLGQTHQRLQLAERHLLRNPYGAISKRQCRGHGQVASRPSLMLSQHHLKPLSKPASKTAWNDTIGGFGIHIPGIGPFGGADFTIPKMANGGITHHSEGIFRA